MLRKIQSDVSILPPLEIIYGIGKFLHLKYVAEVKVLFLRFEWLGKLGTDPD